LHALDRLSAPHCFPGISTWHRCIELFGRTIADQSNLVSTLPTKLDVLIKAATDRYAMMISRRDGRLQACRDFMGLPQRDMSGHFRRIWDDSIRIRNSHFEFVDEVIDKSG
jgi:hypothetical protein